MAALLISNTLGDRVQSALMWLLLLLLSLVWLVSSAAFLTTDVLGWWWAGVVISAGVAGAASIPLAHQPQAVARVQRSGGMSHRLGQRPSRLRRGATEARRRA